MSRAISHRSLLRRPWLGLIVLGACLNPQPDTDPLYSGNPAPTPNNVGLGPAARPAKDNEPAGGDLTGEPEPSAPPTSAPGGFLQDAGAPPPEEPDASRADRTPVALSTRDAGLLQPDAGAPDDGDPQ